MLPRKATRMLLLLKQQGRWTSLLREEHRGWCTGWKRQALKNYQCRFSTLMIKCYREFLLRDSLKKQMKVIDYEACILIFLQCRCSMMIFHMVMVVCMVMIVFVVMDVVFELMEHLVYCVKQNITGYGQAIDQQDKFCKQSHNSQQGSTEVSGFKSTYQKRNCPFI